MINHIHSGVKNYSLQPVTLNFSAVKLFPIIVVCESLTLFPQPQDIGHTNVISL